VISKNFVNLYFINFYFIGIMIIEKLKVGENGDDRETIFVKGSDDF